MFGPGSIVSIVKDSPTSGVLRQIPAMQIDRIFVSQGSIALPETISLVDFLFVNSPRARGSIFLCWAAMSCVRSAIYER